MNPFIVRSVNTICNWRVWRENWNNNVEYTFLHSLLHFGFEIQAKGNEGRERYLFYLRLADGHMHRELSDGTSEQLYRKLSAKAFETLCREVFKGFPGSFERLSIPVDAGTLAATMNFFSGGDDKERRRNIPFTGNHQRDILLRSVFLIVEQFWPEGREYPELRPKFIETLHAIEELDKLLTKRFQETDIILKDDCLAKLEELALEGSYSFPGEPYARRPNTVEEACYAGNKAAQILVNLRVIRNEWRRFKPHLR